MTAMGFLDLVHSASEIVRREGRVGRRALQRHFEIDDDEFADVVDELVAVRQAVVDRGDVLVWAGTAPAASADVAAAHDDRAGERRQLTIMFCDLVESCAMAGRIDAEDLREVLTGYYRASARAVAPYGGHIAEYLGDGLVVYFGYPTAVEDAAVRAVRAALAVLDAVGATNRELVRQRGITLHVRMGVHTGQVVLAEIGEGSSTPSTHALGEVPNVTARLQQVAGPDQIVISEATERLVRGFFELEPLGPQSLKGIATPLGAFRVRAAQDVETRFDVALMGRFATFVGRERELGQLTDEWHAVTRGDFRAVLVTGEAGIGKSRLVQTLGDRVVADGGQHLKCRCSAQHRSTAYFPITDLIARQFGFRPSDANEERLTKLREGVASLGLDEHDVHCLASLLSLPSPAGVDAVPLPPARQKALNFAALRKAVERIAARASLVLTVEDVHWIDPTSAEFFAALRIPGVLLALTGRPESELGWTAPLTPLAIELGRLAREETRALIADVTGARGLPPELIDALCAKTDGIPLFIEEQTKAVLESDMVVERDGSYALTRPLRDMNIAGTLHDSLRARLDRLDRDTKQVAQLAATLGRSFTHELLEAVASTMSPATLHNALTTLLETGLLLQHGDVQHTTYTFRHALVQDVAYQSLLKSTRRAYHLACADALTNWFPDSEQTQPGLIADHYRAAGDVTRAIKYYERAGQLAAEQWALQEAIDHFAQARTLLHELPDDPKRRRRELDLLFALGPALMSTLGYANKVVEDTYSRIRELCESEHLQPKMFAALVGLWQHLMVGGSLRQANDLGAELLKIAEDEGDSTMRLIAMRSLGSTRFLLGDFAGAFTYTSAGWSMYDIAAHGSLAAAHGNDQGVAHGLYLAWTLWTLGRPDAAHAQARAAVELAGRLKHPMSIAFSQAYASTVENLRGDFAAAAELAGAARDVADRHGLALWSAHARTQLGWARMGLGDVAAGMACMEDGIKAWFRTGAGAGGSLMYAVVAEFHLATGDLGTADARLRQAEAMIERTEERFYAAEILRLRGEIALRTHRDRQVARASFTRGLDLARSQGARSWELRLATSIATESLAHGGRDAARAALADCLGRFTEGFETRDLAVAARLLADAA